MRFEVQFELMEKTIILDYRRKFISWLKSILASYNDELKNKYYEMNTSKEFTFAVYLPVKELKKDEIVLSNKKIKLFLSVLNFEDGIHFTNAFINSMNKVFPIGIENKMKVINVRLLNEKKIEKAEVIFKTMSPIVIREHRDQWYHDFDEKGLNILKENTISNLSSKFPEEDINNLEIYPCQMSRTVVLNYGIKFPVTNGIFKVKGKSDILDYLYKTGIGSKSSAGFGMCEILNRER